MYRQAWDKILEAKHIVIASHIHPDGDTLGSSLGLYHAFKGLGKKVSLFNATVDELPREFDFLEGYSKISDKLPKFFDVLISCDCGSFDRLKIPKGDFTLINIDHHKSNELYGNINIVLQDASSAGMVVYKFLEANGVEIKKNSAIALYTSIAEDTGFFRYGNIDYDTFQIVAKLIKCGANAQNISKSIHSRTSLAKIRLRAYMLNNFNLHVNASIATIIIDKKVLEQTGAKRSDTKNIINELKDIANVKVAVMILEQNEFFKISMRSDGQKDVLIISLMYKGGGHKNAAGFNFYENDVKSVCKKMIENIESI